MKKDKLTFENHLERDDRVNFQTLQGIGPESYTNKGWIKLILEVQLDTSLPEELTEMFERAQSCMVYGCYHYPLFTTGCEELHRFGETALKVVARDVPEAEELKKPNFYNLVELFHDLGIFDEAEKSRWHAGRSLRNSASHKEKNDLYGPITAVSSLHSTKELTENLFRKCHARALSK